MRKMPRRKRVEILALLPTVYSNKCKAFCVSVHDSYALQELEYPQELLKYKNMLSEFYQQLVKRFGNLVEVSIVNPLSPRGLWLMLRHRLSGNGLWVVIDGREVVAACDDTETFTREAIKKVEKTVSQ